MTAVILAGLGSILIDQAAAIGGACLVLLAYGLQRFKRISPERFPYLSMNFVGGALLCWAAIRSGQIGFILLEGAWALISLLGLLSVWRSSAGQQNLR
jgi:hypothetical protein